MYTVYFVVAIFLPAWLPADDAKSLPDGPNKELVAKTCIRCHGAATFRRVWLTEDQWWGTVGSMVRRGAQANESEQTQIVAYLTSIFGKDSKVRINSAPPAELTALLGFSPAEADSIVDYRSDYGDFKQWSDLSKVPGVSNAKLEAAKDKVLF